MGPSASGKSSALEAVTKQIFPEQGEKQPGQNKLTSIDGAVERELSQVSHLLVTFAKHQGYQGVVGLHMSEGNKEVKSIKRCILEAVKENKQQDVSIIIPETFSKYGIGGRVGLGRVEKDRLKGEGEIGKMVSFANNTNRGVVLIGIEGKDPREFQNSVAVMGNKRAWDRMGSKAPAISPETKLTSESKAYGANGFRFGVKGSKAATKAFQEEISKYKDLNAQQYRITNDLVAFKQVRGQWLKVLDVADAKKHSDSAVLISGPLAEIWQSKNLDSIDENYRAELQGFISANDLAGFDSYCKENGLSKLNIKEVQINKTQK